MPTIAAPGALAVAVEAEMAAPEFRAATEAVIRAALTAALKLAEAETPALLKPFLVPLEDAGGTWAINKAEDIVDNFLKGMLPATIQLALRVAPVTKTFSADLPQGPEETVGDWPTDRNK